MTHHQGHPKINFFKTISHLLDLLDQEKYLEMIKFQMKSPKENSWETHIQNEQTWISKVQLVLNTRNYHLVNYQVWIKDKKVQLRLSHQHYQIDLANIDGFKVGRKIDYSFY